MAGRVAFYVSFDRLEVVVCCLYISLYFCPLISKKMAVRVHRANIYGSCMV
jgi:hypothetical protein